MKINGKNYAYSWGNKRVEVSDLVGKTFSKVYHDENEQTIFFCNDDEVFVMMHGQCCCENVYVDDICGDLSDLENFPLLIAREDSNSDDPKSEYHESFTWTFYNFSTNRGSVTIRWYGQSNGYYSESVSLIQLSEENNG